ncbi:MAG TPA: glycoside hydrolase family 97 protein [Pyrinomonadaceae bacterium]|jgi:alpha-glucosidase
MDAFAQTEALPLKLVSPGSQLEITLALNERGALAYSVSYRGQAVLIPSALGLEFKQGGLLSQGLRVTNVRRDERDENYTLAAGKTREARDHYNELTVSLEEQGAPRRKLELIFRAYDDGAAFRYRLPSQTAVKDFELAAERSEFRFPADLDCWALQLGSFTTSYEGEYDHIISDRIRADAVIGLPLVCRSRDERTTFALSESDLKDYAGLYFARVAGGGYGVTSRLAPRRDDKSVAVRGTVSAEGFVTPWRVVMVSSEAAKLIESTLIQNLSTPSVVNDTSWIRPGRSAWDWWSGPNTEGAAFKVGMNDATMKHYIDFASEMGLEYMLIDAGWYSPLPGYGPQMDLKADLTKTIPEIDLPGLVSYARGKNVGLWVWAHWRLVNDQMDAAFPHFERLGIKGVKIDFMDSDDQEMVAFYHRVLRKAAEHHLLVDLHGAYKPTGLARTYPNYLTQEGVMGAEYNKWSARVTATHNVTLAFTRLLLGPMDYTPGAFRNRARREFNVKFIGPEVMTTRAHQLAMYVVYESPFACVSDNPEAYRGQAGAEFLKIVPTTWDETRAIGGRIGEYVVVARRRGREWYVGALNNEEAREIQLPLIFLGGGGYKATVYADGAQAGEVVVTTTADINSGKFKGTGGLMTLKLAPGGGAALRLTPIK